MQSIIVIDLIVNHVVALVAKFSHVHKGESSESLSELKLKSNTPVFSLVWEKKTALAGCLPG